MALKVTQSSLFQRSHLSDRVGNKFCDLMLEENQILWYGFPVRKGRNRTRSTGGSGRD